MWPKVDRQNLRREDLFRVTLPKGVGGAVVLLIYNPSAGEWEVFYPNAPDDVVEIHELRTDGEENPVLELSALQHKGLQAHAIVLMPREMVDMSLPSPERWAMLMAHLNGGREDLPWPIFRFSITLLD